MLQIELKNVTVSKNDLLGDLHNAYSVIENVLDVARVAIAAEMLGNSSKAFEITLDYLKERPPSGIAPILSKELSPKRSIDKGVTINNAKRGEGTH